MRGRDGGMASAGWTIPAALKHSKTDEIENMCLFLGV
jgi:hypothetical protein